MVTDLCEILRCDSIEGRSHPDSLPIELQLIYSYDDSKVEKYSENKETEFATKPIEEFVALINGVLNDSQFIQIKTWEESGWNEIDYNIAIKVLLNLVRFSQAYEVEIRNLSDAMRVVKKFLSNFSMNSRFICTSELYLYLNNEGQDIRKKNKGTCGGMWISDFTFDSGLFVIDLNKIGMMWSFDED